MAKAKLEPSTEEHMLRASVFQLPPHTHTHTHQPHTLRVMTATPAKPQKAMGQTTERAPVYHSVLYFTQATEPYHYPAQPQMQF